MSLNDIKKFLYLGPTLNIFEISNSKLLSNLFSNAKLLIEQNNRPADLLNCINDYLTSYSQFNHLNTNKNVINNIDCIIYLLACCSKLSKDENFIHKVYETLVEISETPNHLFAFEYYSNLIQEVEIDKNYQQPTSSSRAEKKKVKKHIGKGHKKALIKWYSSRSESDLIRLVTQYKHSYNWTNKDLFKLIHMKPKNDGFSFIIKYVMFGFDKVKEENLDETYKNLKDYVTDLYNLKLVKSGEEAAALIRNNKFYFEHLPSKLFKYKEIWLPLIEQMNVKEFCENLHRLLKKDLIKPSSDIERFVLDKILVRDNPDLKLLSPIYTCLGSQIYEHFTSIKLIKSRHNAHNQIIDRSGLDRLRDSMWNSFLASVQHNKSQPNSSLNNMRVMIVVEINSLMRNGHTNGLNYLNPIDTSSCVLLTLYYINNNPANVDVFTASDKLTKIDLANKENQSQPDLSTIESIFQGFASIEKNPTDKIFEWTLQNKKFYDLFIFLKSSDQNNIQIQSEIDFIRENTISKDSKLVIINLTGKTDDENKSSILRSTALDLYLNGWNFDSFFILDSFLKAKF